MSWNEEKERQKRHKILMQKWSPDPWYKPQHNVPHPRSERTRQIITDVALEMAGLEVVLEM